MPYIQQEDRNVTVDLPTCFSEDDVLSLTEVIVGLQELIQTADESKRKGLANYIVTRIVAGGMRPSDGWNYSSLSDARGVFTDAGSEFERRLIATYEEQCINKNSDLPEYRR